MLGMGYSTSPHTHPIKSSILKAWLRLCNMLPHLEFQCVVDSVSTSTENYLFIAQYRVYNSEKHRKRAECRMWAIQHSSIEEQPMCTIGLP